MAALTEDDTKVVVVVVAVTAPSCKACSFLKYASRNDDVVIGLADAVVFSVVGVGAALLVAGAVVDGVWNLRFCRSIASLL